jgi:nucleoside-diphosphate-sugar epimerase
MMDAIERGRFPPLPATNNKRSLVHVDDVIRAALLAAESPRANGQVYIVTDGHAYSTDDIVRTMRDALGKPARGWAVPLGVLRMVAAAGDLIGRLRGRRFVFDSNAYGKLLGSAWYSSGKIEQELGFRARCDLRDGVEEMVKGFRATGRAGLGATPT